MFTQTYDSKMSNPNKQPKQDSPILLLPLSPVYIKYLAVENQCLLFCYFSLRLYGPFVTLSYN